MVDIVSEDQRKSLDHLINIENLVQQLCDDEKYVEDFDKSVANESN